MKGDRERLSGDGAEKESEGDREIWRENGEKNRESGRVR